MNKELKYKLVNFIDQLEENYGDLEGFEVKLEHPIVDGVRQKHANIKEFVIISLHRDEIKVNE